MEMVMSGYEDKMIEKDLSVWFGCWLKERNKVSIAGLDGAGK